MLCAGCSTTTKFPNEQISASQFTFAPKTQEYDTPPVLLSGRMPEYPLVARIRHEFGLVVARFLIDLDDRTKQLRFEGKPPPALATSLALAMQGWRFQPALKMEKPFLRTPASRSTSACRGANGILLQRSISVKRFS